MLTLTKKCLTLISALCAGVILQGCTTTYVDHSRPIAVHSSNTIAVLPFKNVSGVRFAGLRSSIIAANVLSARGMNVIRVPLYRGHKLSHRLAWARAHGIRLALTGIVTEWGYRQSGATVYPVVSIALALRDTMTGQVVWASAGSRDNSFEFYYQSNVSAAAQTLIVDELSSIDIYGPRYTQVNFGRVYYGGVSSGYYYNGNYEYNSGYVINR